MSDQRKNKLAKLFYAASLALAGVGAMMVVSRFTSRANGQAGAVVEKIPAAAPDAHVAAKSPEEAGRYLVMIGGCNDCHTPGYSMAGGQVPELEWLTGSPIGWYGPWGTTYASNLRLIVAGMTEDAWAKMMHDRHDRPPMPWSSVNSMSDTDTRAIYRYIKQLGKQGEKMPDPVAAGGEPKTPYLSMIPQSPAEKK